MTYFGQKDLQQLIIIRQLVKELCIPTSIIGVPTVRESDGLACSSRNQNLSAIERKSASVLFEALGLAKNNLKNGHNMEGVKPIVLKLCKEHGAVLDYVEAIDPETLEIVSNAIPGRKIYLCIAARIGNVRLIDNIPVFE
jgi:pantoate--beta-alanine ligase